MEKDRTELNDLSNKNPKLVQEMSKKWFEIAKNKERLKDKGLTPIKPKFKPLSFRRDTSAQLD
jgi:hypothetical protein